MESPDKSAQRGQQRARGRRPPLCPPGSGLRSWLRWRAGVGTECTVDRGQLGGAGLQETGVRCGRGSSAGLSPSHPGAAMHCPLWHCCVISMGLGVLWLLFMLEVPREVEDDQDRMAVKVQAAALPSLCRFRVGGGCGQHPPLSRESRRLRGVGADLAGPTGSQRS